jgi:hypothetical protein
VEGESKVQFSFFIEGLEGTPSLYIRAHSLAREVIWFFEFVLCDDLNLYVAKLLIGKRIFSQRWTTELSGATGEEGVICITVF